MADSTRKRVLDNIKTTLAAITAGATYTLTAGEVARGYKHFGAAPEDKLIAGKFCAYIAGADEERKNAAQRTFSSELLVTIAGYVKINDAPESNEALEHALDNMIEDFTKALMVDVTRGGYAVTTEIGKIDTDQGAFAPFAQVEMIVKVEYRAAVTAP